MKMSVRTSCVNLKVKDKHEYLGLIIHSFVSNQVILFDDRGRSIDFTEVITMGNP